MQLPGLPDGVAANLRGAAKRARSAIVRPPRLDRFAPVRTLRLPEHPVQRAPMAAIDAHNHLGRWLTRGGGWMAPDVSRLLDDMDGCGLAAIVNLDGRWGDELQDNLARYDLAHPDRFATFCQLDWRMLAEPGSAGSATESLVRSLRESADRGARGVKVWKDLGRSVRDAHGELVLPDDRRLDDLWAVAGALGLPILIHVADPVAFFQPIDGRNERVEELTRSPASSWARPGIPDHGRLIDALESAVERTPGTTWIAAHVASCAEDLARVSGMLARYPNLYVDIAARAGDLGRQPRAAARFITEHHTRVLFGTDVFPFRPDEIRIYFRLLGTDDECFPYSTAAVPPAGRWEISGLDLAEHVLADVYTGNARRLLPSLRTSEPAPR